MEREEFMKEVFHETKDTPLNPLSPSRRRSTEKTCPPLSSVRERLAQAREGGGVSKMDFA